MSTKQMKAQSPRLLIAAAVILVIHGGVMEILFPIVMPHFVSSSTPVPVEEMLHFALPLFNNNLPMMTIMGVVWGSLRLMAALGIFMKRIWGVWLGGVMSVVTLAVMLFMIPIGMLDGLWSGACLVLILMGTFGARRFDEADDAALN